LGRSQAPRPSAKPVSDADILASLPSGPRARDDDEPRSGMGGAFREYGGDRGGRGAQLREPVLLALRLDLSTCDACTTHTQRHCPAPARVAAATAESQLLPELLRECPLARQLCNGARRGSAAGAKLGLCFKP